MKELEKILKEIKEKNINLGDLEIMDNINYQSEFYLEIKLSEEEKKLVLERVHKAWLKTEDIPIYQLVTTALENLKRLKDMTTWEIVEETMWRCF